jgi:hypothetical protein
MRLVAGFNLLLVGAFYQRAALQRNAPTAWRSSSSLTTRSERYLLATDKESPARCVETTANGLTVPMGQHRQAD